MRRVNVVFVALVIGASLAGGVAAASFGSDLRTFETISLVKSQLDSDVTALHVANGELRISVRLANPTGYPVRLRGTFVRIFADDGTQLAYGAGERVDDGSEVISARGHLTAEYVVRLSAEQTDRLKAAVEARPIQVRLFHSLSLRDKSFRLIKTDETVSGEVDN